MKLRKLIITIPVALAILIVSSVVAVQTIQADEPKGQANRLYFRFEIPTMPDGSRVKYSPGWHGVSAKCPNDVTVLYYNDKEGWGLAYTTDSFIPKESISVTASTCNNILDTARDEKGVYFGQKLADRWLPVAEVKEVQTQYGNTGDNSKSTVTEKVLICPVCEEKIIQYIDNLSRIAVTCSKGHKVILCTTGDCFDY